MANLGSVTLKYFWRLSKFVMGRLFNMQNITVPCKFLASLLFGFRYLSKEERMNKKLLRDTWAEMDSNLHYAGRTTTSVSPAKEARAFSLMRRGRVLGLSKMLLKSIIFAVAGILATLIFRLINKRKARQLATLEAQRKKEEEELLQAEWDKLNKSK
mmetsp:Transcript_9720/g.13284  ORF Transcript_9720/g.13284 Transcript_9720/m.13284 type:complete len:157 (+) Transcript_9720:245-715(+)